MSSPFALKLLAGQLSQYHWINQHRESALKYRAALDALDIARLVERLDADGARTIPDDVVLRVRRLPGFIEIAALVHALEAVNTTCPLRRIKAMAFATSSSIDLQLTGLTGLPEADVCQHLHAAWQMANELAQAITAATDHIQSRAA